jgi:hypothetical protein
VVSADGFMGAASAINASYMSQICFRQDGQSSQTMASGDEVIITASQSGHINLNFTIEPTALSVVPELPVIRTEVCCNRRATIIYNIFNELTVF